MCTVLFGGSHRSGFAWADPHIDHVEVVASGTNAAGAQVCLSEKGRSLRADNEK